METGVKWLVKAFQAIQIRQPNFLRNVLLEKYTSAQRC
jgi:hypothetical protein